MGCLVVIVVPLLVFAALQAGVVWGVIALVVLVGPMAVGGYRLYFTESGRQFRGETGQEFIAAWERRNGPIRPGGRRPDKAMAEAWMKARDETGISADDWFDLRRTGTIPARDSRLVARGHWNDFALLPDLIDENKVEGTLAATSVGLVRTPSGPQPESILPWSRIEGYKSYRGSGGILLLYGGGGTAVIKVEDSGREPWHRAFEAHGVPDRTD